MIIAVDWQAVHFSVVCHVRIVPVLSRILEAQIIIATKMLKFSNMPIKSNLIYKYVMFELLQINCNNVLLQAPWACAMPSINLQKCSPKLAEVMDNYRTQKIICLTPDLTSNILPLFRHWILFQINSPLIGSWLE